MSGVIKEVHAHVQPMGLTSQGSGIPMDPGRKSPAASSCHTRLKPSTSVSGSSPIRGITAQLDWEG